MASKVPFYRMYLPEKLRKNLGINLKNRRVYIFSVKGRTFLSMNVLPKNAQFSVLKVKLGNSAWYIDLPSNLTHFEPNSYKVLNIPGFVIELLK